MNKWLIELSAIYIALPAILFVFSGFLKSYSLFVLLGVCLYCFIKLKDRRIFYRLKNEAQKLTWVKVCPIIKLSLIIVICSILSIELFNIPMPTNQYLDSKSGVLLLIAYPLLSVFPQELVFRLYFFERYKQKFKSEVVFICVNVACFTLSHIIYQNWLAIILSAVGGFIFCYRFIKTNNFLIVIIEHSLLGLFVFLIGFGDSFLSIKI